MKEDTWINMKYKSTNSGFGYVARFEKGERLIESVKDMVRKEGIKGGFFYGLGALEDVEVGRFDLEKKEYEFKSLLGVYELASLNGNIVIKDGEPIVHAHAVLGDKDLNAVAGHIREAKVAITSEIFIHLQHGVEMARAKDKETGLDLLEFK